MSSLSPDNIYSQGANFLYKVRQTFPAKTSVDLTGLRNSDALVYRSKSDEVFCANLACGDVVFLNAKLWQTLERRQRLPSRIDITTMNHTDNNSSAIVQRYLAAGEIQANTLGTYYSFSQNGEAKKQILLPSIVARRLRIPLHTASRLPDNKDVVVVGTNLTVQDLNWATNIINGLEQTVDVYLTEMRRNYN